MRQADALEIEITPEMIEAGMNAIDPLDHGYLSREDEIKMIWCALYRAFLNQ